ncbi:MAG TPA: COX15/CtaA family protein [Anaerolineales bacterium]|nr:COX15/CtaA family protein [Anaerolineales bacterium]
MNRFAKFSWIVLAWTELDILWGAFVRASGSGAGCGNHWPTCNGDILPTPQHLETFIEFTHRTLSGVALLLVLALLIWGWRSHPKGHPVRIGATGSAVFILLEAALGAGLVLLDLVAANNSALRAAAVAVHLLNTFFLLAFLALTAWWASGGNALTLKQQGALPLLFGLGLAGVALLGMTGAITALGDTLFPARTLAQGLAQDADLNASFLVRLRVIHPILASLVGLYLLGLAQHLHRKTKPAASRRLSLLVGGLVLSQLTAGILNLLLLAPIWMQIVHLLLADSVWVSLVLLSASSLASGRQTRGAKAAQAKQ